MAGTLRRPVLLELVETLRRLPRLEALHHLLRMATHLRRHHVETVKQFLTHASVCLLRGATHQSVGHVSQWGVAADFQDTSTNRFHSTPPKSTCKRIRPQLTRHRVTNGEERAAGGADWR